MTKAAWLSLGLQEDALPAFEAGGLRTVEAAGSIIVGIRKSTDGYDLLGTAASGDLVDTVMGRHRGYDWCRSVQSDGVNTRAQTVRVRPSGERPWNTMSGSTCRWS